MNKPKIQLGWPILDSCDIIEEEKHIEDEESSIGEKNPEQQSSSKFTISSDEAVTEEEIPIEKMNVDQIVYTFNQIVYEEPLRPSNPPK